MPPLGVINSWGGRTGATRSFQQGVITMKRFTYLTMMLGSLLLISGCSNWGSDPAYSASELAKQDVRNINYEGAQITDDVDTILMRRPMGHLTEWQLY